MIAAVHAPLVSAAPAPDCHSQEKEIAALRQEVAELRRLMLGYFEAEAKKAEILAKIAKGAAPLPAPPPAAKPPKPAAPSLPDPPDMVSVAPQPERGRGAVTGRVTLKGVPIEGAWIFVEDIPAPPVDRTVEIAQINKKFSPEFAVVRKGTRIEFPNRDKILHNVFSLSPGNAFDLGKYHSGEPARSRRFFATGVVAVFCDLHTDMEATILVVPNDLYVRSGPDGTFTLSGVPEGKRQIVAWAPNANPLTVSVQVGPAAKSVALDLSSRERKYIHKDGSPRGSYD